MVSAAVLNDEPVFSYNHKVKFLCYTVRPYVLQYVLHICVYIDIPCGKEMFIMSKNDNFMTIETGNLEGNYIL